jgi:LPXTG-motif cell wall-anchored protein
MKMLATVSALGLTDCPVGPFTIHTSTVNGGTKYSAGNATVADPSYAVPVIPSGASGCAGNEAAVNSALGLPGRSGITMDVGFAPVLTGSGVVPTSTTTITTTTTTVKPTTTTTVKTATTPQTSTRVAAATATLPRTGSSSAPLAIFGLSLLAAGVALWQSGRRRSRRTG